MSQPLRCLIAVVMLSCLGFAQESANKTQPSSSTQKPEKELQRSKSRPNSQDGDPQPVRAEDLDLIRKIELSTEAKSWAVQIRSSGGITGNGRGNVTITSQGNLYWDEGENQCNAKLGEDVLQKLTQMVFSAKASKWGVTTAGFCADCYGTQIMLQRREADGKERTYTAYWDDPAAARIPGDLMSLYDTFMAYKGCRQ